MNIKNLAVITSIFALVSCQKDTKEKTAFHSITNGNQSVTYDYKDTVTRIQNRLRTDAAPILSSGIDYIGNGQYKFTIFATPAARLTGCDFYRNGNIYETGPSPVLSPYSATHTLPPGNYNYLVGIVGEIPGGLHAVAQVNIIAKPTSPSGMICLFQYYNSTNGQHICTSDWEELASMSHNFQIEKVLGYIYASSNAAPNLKPIYRYYNASTGSHYTTGTLGNYSGFVFEKILGYVGATATSTLSRPLTKYYNRFLDDHFVCVQPEVPQTVDYVKDGDFIFGYVK